MSSTIYSNDRAYSNSWLVYLNGLEVPAVGVSTSYGVWQMPQASIQMVPDPILQRIGAEDRLQATVFYCDQWRHNPPQFCLLFDGEITAWGYTRTAGQRTISLQCIDYAAILTQLFFFFMSSFDDMAVGASNQSIGVMGSTIQLAGFGAIYPYSLFSQGLADPGDGTGNNEIIKRPIDFAYNVVRALIKAQHPDRAIPATNFFAPWVKRTNFHRRWIALPYFDEDPDGNNRVGVFPILKAVQSESALAATARMASTTGGAGSIWDMISEILRNMLMEISMLPTAAAVHSDFVSLLPRGVPSPGHGQIFLTNYFVKPQCFFGLPPVSNVIFPSQIASYSYEENYATQPTRMYFNEERMLQFLNQNGTSALTAAGNSLAQDAMCTGFPEEVDIAARDAVGASGQNGKNLLVYPEEFFKGPVIDRRAMPRWFSFLLDSMRITDEGGGQEGDAQEEDESSNTPTHGQTTLNPNNPNGSPQAGVTTQALTPEQTAQFKGAEGVIKDVRPGRFASVFGRNPEHGFHFVVTDDELRDYNRVTASRGGLGEFVAPQRSPLDPPVNSARIPKRTDSHKAGSFWATRSRSGQPNVVHAGHDIGVPVGTRVVATTNGRIADVGRRPEGSHHRGIFISVRDESGGIHRYLHLSEIARKNGVPWDLEMPVTAGDLLGLSGRTGDTPTQYAAHLHYDVTSSGHYKLDFTNRLNTFMAGRPAPEIAHAVAQQAPAQPASPTQTPTQQTPTPTEAAATAPSQADPQTSQVSPTDTTRNLYKLYAAYEYYKERYSKRQGAVNVAFNPYPIPGFPCATFDARDSACDTIGYLMSVRQTLSPQEMSTQLAFSHGRTFSEMFALMQRTAALEALRSAQNYDTVSGAVRDRPLSPAAGSTDTGTTPGAAAGSGASSDAGTTPDAAAGSGTPEGPAATGTPDERLAGIPLPVGAIATAPAEPIEEIRKVIQSFHVADEFYKSVFWQGRAAGLDVLDAERYNRARQTQGSTMGTNQNVAQLSAALARGQTVADAVEAARDQIAEQEATEQNRAPVIARPDLPFHAAFYYPDIIQMITPFGTPIPISIEGLDSGVRTTLLRAIASARAGRATGAERQLLFNTRGIVIPETERVGENEAQGVSIGTPAQFQLSSALNEELVQLEIELRTESVQSNVRGDVRLAPTAQAKPLFESYEAAMAYNARPICTLDEYIDFLGEDGLREQLIAPGNSELYTNRQVHPAHFYIRIRRFHQGPPAGRPAGNLTGTLSMTDAPAGVGASVQASLATPFTNLADYLERYDAATQDFILERVRNAVGEAVDPATIVAAALDTGNSPGSANVLPPSTRGIFQTLTGSATVENFSTLLPQIASSGLFTPAEVAQLQQQFDRLARQLGGLVPAIGSDAEVSGAPQNAPTTGSAGSPTPAQSPSGATPTEGAFGSTTVTIGNHEYTQYPVDGIPDDFPDTRADWDFILEQYRLNVLAYRPNANS